MSRFPHAAVVQTIIELARRLRIDVLAEGVERTELRDCLLERTATRLTTPCRNR